MRRHRLTLDRALDGVDEDALAAIWARHSEEPDANVRGKYAETRPWMARNIARAEAIGLDQGPPRRVLDLGCGCGYFLHVCRCMGHEVLGVDHPGDRGVYGEMTAALGVPVRLQIIERFVPLMVGDGWGAVTAHMVTFNGHRANVWGAEEWDFFVRDALASLEPGGVLRLDLNREPDGRLMSADVEKLFLAHGAGIRRHQVTIARRA